MMQRNQGKHKSYGPGVAAIEATLKLVLAEAFITIQTTLRRQSFPLHLLKNFWRTDF
jgi:hypothetical protein